MRYSLFVFLFIYACSGDPGRDIRSYYYPVEALKSGTVYAYETTQNGAATPEYWFYRSTDRDSGQFLEATYLDANQSIRQLSLEKIVNNGSLARSYILIEPDTIKREMVRIRATIESPNLFPFQVHDSTGVFLFSLKYQPLDDPQATIYVIRNRRFMGDGPDYEFKGEKYPCIRFGIREAIGREKEGSSETEGAGEEWYAKGLGLVYYRKVYDKGKFIQETRLLDTLSAKRMQAGD